VSARGRPVAIAGIGYSGVYRGPSPSVEALTTDACRAAIGDAGLSPSDIDGIFEYQIGHESPKCHYVQRALRTGDLAAYADIMGTGASGLAAALAAVDAVASGACETALAFRGMEQQAGNTGSAVGDAAIQVGGTPMHDELVAPFGMFGIIPAMALRMARRKFEYGGRPEDYGHIALNARRWAALNPRAVQRQALTMEEYLGAKMLCDPLRLLDCDYPVSGACAVIITTAERARDLPHRVVGVAAHAQATGDGDWIFGEDFLYGGAPRCAERLWARSGLGPADIELAQLYDGFTYMTLTWLEALGFCKFGEAGGWLDEGRMIGPGGRLPLNTTGGQLAEGRLHGLSFLAEAVLQLRGEAAARQAGNPRSAVVAVSSGPQCGGMILLRD
jgi:acetyl-CoA acetyltransferase